MRNIVCDWCKRDCEIPYGQNLPSEKRGWKHGVDGIPILYGKEISFTRYPDLCAACERAAEEAKRMAEEVAKSAAASVWREAIEKAAQGRSPWVNDELRRRAELLLPCPTCLATVFVSCKIDQQEEDDDVVRLGVHRARFEDAERMDPLFRGEAQLRREDLRRRAEKDHRRRAERHACPTCSAEVGVSCKIDSEEKENLVHYLGAHRARLDLIEGVTPEELQLAAAEEVEAQ